MKEFSGRRVLVTGAAGFIGSAACWALLDGGCDVIGVDNHNDYYDPEIKNARVALTKARGNYKHFKLDISNIADLETVFNQFLPEIVINLAAQVGVRYSVVNPSAYVQSNLVGFANILSCSQKYKVEHLIYASSSSVYGANTNIPFSTKQNVDHPLSFYAATKRSNELMAHAYSHLHGLPVTGLRFFTVYGPWGRPDMALFKFTKSILSGDPIEIYNEGRHLRDFTYIDDVVKGILACIKYPPQPNNDWTGKMPMPDSSLAPWRIYNIGSGTPVSLMDYVSALESALGLTAKKKYLPLQDGDMHATFADTENFNAECDFRSETRLQEGVHKFVEWYLSYCNG